MAGVARRLVAAATLLMPPSHRDWGRAIAAELDHADSAGDRARLVAAAISVALVPSPGLAGYAQAAGWAARVAVIAYLPVGTWIYLANALFPPSQGSTLPHFYLAAVMMAAGALARRAPARPGRAVLAGVSAGLVLGGLFLVTLAAWGDPVDLGALVAPGLTGAVFAPVGAALGRAVASRRRPGGQPLPGLKMPNGSRARRTASCMASAPGSSSRRMPSRLRRPMPCSPDTVPPSSIAASRNSSKAA